MMFLNVRPSLIVIVNEDKIWILILIIININYINVELMSNYVHLHSKLHHIGYLLHNLLANEVDHPGGWLLGKAFYTWVCMAPTKLKKPSHHHSTMYTWW